MNQNSVYLNKVLRFYNSDIILYNTYFLGIPNTNNFINLNFNIKA